MKSPHVCTRARNRGLAENVHEIQDWEIVASWSFKGSLISHLWKAQRSWTPDCAGCKAAVILPKLHRVQLAKHAEGSDKSTGDITARPPPQLFKATSCDTVPRHHIVLGGPLLTVPRNTFRHGVLAGRSSLHRMPGRVGQDTDILLCIHLAMSARACLCSAHRVAATFAITEARVGGS
eukprot:6093640-Amphidinium_carterae.1